MGKCIIHFVEGKFFAGTLILMDIAATLSSTLKDSSYSVGKGL